MNVQLESSDIDVIVETVVGKLYEKLAPCMVDLVGELMRPDELLDKQRVYKEIFNCTATTFDDLYYSRPDFPVFDPGIRPDGSKAKLKFSRKAIEKWIAENGQTRAELF
ncbi:TPA: hypothetical protein QCW01_001549 [Bacillus thuringiensis]|uniref:hypothetical protein n=1 Tax=Bacillus cereus group TaxID=86661 RepID=UPI0003AD907B|nr:MULTISPECIES: hypothetical protein [Bacillus cereus group]ETE99584.1 hypothetical protein C623_0203260 [Bacillus thuringiensis serovar aizawai str. Hu4-2]KAB1364126.1 hypothetical protein FPG89_31060 [Bacillus thuringiensis]KLA14632.1 hypothetical protein B4158_4435 [Bacillus cereus]MCC3935426.1 hypothetical protein [Bacillus thuringiensis]MCC3954103.1 hypothetical protein [Bacillus thuringiensis]